VAPVVRVTLVVRRARPEEIFPLRHAVLRAGRPVTESVYGEDPTAVHVGAWDEEVLVGCATVFAQPWPGGISGAPPAEPGAWRLRGMAVDPSRRRGGVGRQVLDVAVAAVRETGAPLLWAEARTTALDFYGSYGFATVGEEFLTGATGLPHKRIVLPLP
jgi:GNAT superfamily N-acetyltransferase